uniref:Vacuolar fusion protein MON1 homolog n=1 Tax=Lynceus sp. MCZ IZ 141354 TaxID=1930659 RepID=A0A9N6WYC1_9CRUS|nr:EOG090X03TW [Lynceus sp. MCZ IZ 141354]
MIVSIMAMTNDRLSVTSDSVKSLEVAIEAFPDDLQACGLNLGDLDLTDAGYAEEIVILDKEGDICQATTIEWTSRTKHVFVLTEAGKPVYSRHGDEENLVTLFGVMQAMVSFVEDSGDVLQCIKAGDTSIVFLHKSPLILCCSSKDNHSYDQIMLLLNYVFDQIISVTTASRLYKAFDQRSNFDPRNLLAGSERLLDSLVEYCESSFDVMLQSVKCLPLMSVDRDCITQTIVQCCSKVENLVFAVLIAKGELVTLVRLQKTVFHPADLHLVLNLVNSTESFKGIEGWTPICLPHFDQSGYLHAYVSYLAEDCQACLVLFTVNRDSFYVLSEVKQRITEKLRRHNLFECINSSMSSGGFLVCQTGVAELRHFIYNSKFNAQYTTPFPGPPYPKQRLLQLYMQIQKHARNRIVCMSTSTEVVLGLFTPAYDLYAVFEPMTTKAVLAAAIPTITKFVKREEDWLFIANAATFS